MPPKKAKKAKKLVQQKQKQKQSQRVVVNVNQPLSKAKKRRVRRVIQQVVSQPLITTSGSVPQPVPVFNPSPVQSSGGFNMPTPIPTSLGAPIPLSAPVEVPVFGEETPIVIGGEQFPTPVVKPVKVPEPVPVSQPIIVPVKPPIAAENPIIIPRPPPAPVAPVISTPSIISGITSAPSSQLIAPPPQKKESISSLLRDVSKETGINSKSVADFIFKKKKEQTPPASGNKSIVSDLTKSAGPTTIFAENWKNELKAPKAPIDNDPLFFTKEDLSVAGPPASLPTISTRSGFYNEPYKGSFTNETIIVPPKEVVVLKKPELKRRSAYDPFGDNESLATEPSLAVIPKMGGEKPPKKRPVVMSSDSERELNIIPLDKPAGRLPTVKERRSNYVTLAELQEQAVKNKISITRENGKKKTREELRLEILG